ncbi:hypothetical protein SUGI_1059550 [Cryptomeria japonica]|nr:hypothetical protein SUGI_1059550 [Cryptomeria japonica]
MASMHAREEKKQMKRQANHFELLPEEINAKILSRLPLPNVFQAQSVCHSWRTIVCSSPHFQKLWDEKNNEQWLAMDDCDGGVEIFNTNGEFKKKMFEFSNSWILKAAGGGLLLYLNESDGMLQVVNPLTMEARQLPDPIMGELEHLSFYLTIEPAAIDLIVDSTTKIYEVIVFMGLKETAYLLIFRSSTSFWETKVVKYGFKGFTAWSLYKTVDQTVLRDPLKGIDSYITYGELVHRKKKDGGGFVMGENVKVVVWEPPIGRSFVFIFELDEVSSQWRVLSVCRWNIGYIVSFGELL